MLAGGGIAPGPIIRVGTRNGPQVSEWGGEWAKEEFGAIEDGQRTRNQFRSNKNFLHAAWEWCMTGCKISVDAVVA